MLGKDQEGKNSRLFKQSETLQPGGSAREPATLAGRKSIGTGKVTRVVLADDHSQVRAGIRRILESMPGISIVGEAKDGIEALDMASTLCPDMMILDIEMPGITGIQVAARLKETRSDVRILAVSAHDDRQYIMSLLDNGASGYLTKDEAPALLKKAVLGVARGEEGWVSSRVAEKIANWNKPTAGERVTLTLRELDVLRGLVQRKMNVDIAASMGVSEQVVERHVALLSAKLKVNSRTELISRAVNENLV